MICIECMTEKNESDYLNVFYSQLSFEPLFCLCIQCINKKEDYPTLNSIH